MRRGSTTTTAATTGISEWKRRTAQHQSASDQHSCYVREREVLVSVSAAGSRSCPSFWYPVTHTHSLPSPSSYGERGNRILLLPIHTHTHATRHQTVKREKSKNDTKTYGSVCLSATVTKPSASKENQKRRETTTTNVYLKQFCLFSF